MRAVRSRNRSTQARAAPGLSVAMWSPIARRSLAARLVHRTLTLISVGEPANRRRVGPAPHHSVVAEHAPGVRVSEPFLHGCDEVGLIGQAIELLWSQQDGCCLAILRDDKRPATFPKVSNFLGEMGLQVANRDDILCDP